VQKDRVKAAQDFKKAKKEELELARANLNKKI
jgi:hypothetical protein